MPPTKTLTLSLDNVFACLAGRQASRGSGKVTAFFSDRSIDFILKEGETALSFLQKEFLSKQFGFPVTKIINIRQVHGDHVLAVAAEDLENQGPLPEADGIITNTIGIPVAVRTADCLPVFIFDPKKNCIGIVHAGWRGSEKQIALKAVKLMRDYWASAPEDLKIVFGPAIRSCCYQVGEEFKAFFPKEIYQRDGKLFLDLVLSNRTQLLRYGVKPKNIFDLGICTCCNQDYFSYRREGSGAGRHISAMVLRP